MRLHCASIHNLWLTKAKSFNKLLHSLLSTALSLNYSDSNDVTCFRDNYLCPARNTLTRHLGQSVVRNTDPSDAITHRRRLIQTHSRAAPDNSTITELRNESHPTEPACEAIEEPKVESSRSILQSCE
ncbi:hypothetical protein PHET_06301 [Paragonimus heterotremus]|uniref:Uncharacterized protein n=1 Tax=Paragonimus heterotremus TaxID=100268 RepID=A0A8J4SZ36_9TREM|nr:hypothetical protein PHET_06301 [Paragonimus heterotremus]